jgi:hypothetical protein
MLKPQSHAIRTPYLVSCNIPTRPSWYLDRLLTTHLSIKFRVAGHRTCISYWWKLSRLIWKCTLSHACILGRAMPPALWCTVPMRLYEACLGSRQLHAPHNGWIADTYGILHYAPPSLQHTVQRPATADLSQYHHEGLGSTCAFPRGWCASTRWRRHDALRMLPAHSRAPRSTRQPGTYW